MDCKKILLFGGSYNPIHQGHINAALNAHHYLKTDEVWLLPRKYNYDGSLLLDGKHRLNMINMAISELPDFMVCPIELKDNHKKLIYTYNTAVKLKKKYPNYKFYFLIGADQLNNIERWFEFEKLMSLFTFVCFKRPGYKLNIELINKYNIEIINGIQIDASSTGVRAGYFEKVDTDIKEYIMDNILYLKERLMPSMPEKLFIHCLSTARFAKRTAKELHINTNRAYVAGILHDVSKSLPFDEIYSIILNHYPQYSKLPKYCLHQYASAYIAEHEYGIKDKKILKAIASHARANYKMSLLDKLIYCADKLEETRDFANSVKTIRDISTIDIDKCFILTMEDQINHLKKTNQNLDEHLVHLKKYYEEKYNG